MPAKEIRFIERRVAKNNLGVPRIGRISQSKNGLLYYKGRHFEPHNFPDLHTNFRCVETGEYYLITDCDPYGNDQTMNGYSVIIDDDIREFYWKVLRREPQKLNEVFSDA